MAVTYERVNWVDEPSTDTPLSAENLNKMDEGLSDLASWSEEAEESLDNKADIDGTYDDLTAGTAKQITPTTLTEEKVPYLLRKSGGALDVDGVSYDKIIGGSIVWNQLVPKTAASGTVAGGVSVTNNDDGSFSFSGEATSSQRFIFCQINGLKDHVYLCTGISGGSNSAYYFVTTYNGSLRSYIYNDTVFKPSAVYNDFSLRVINGSSYETPVTVTPQLYDLTQMFGTEIADYVNGLETATAGSGVAWLKAHFPAQFNSGYKDYNAGEIVSVSGLESHDITEKNIWGGERILQSFIDASIINFTYDENTLSYGAAQVSGKSILFDFPWEENTAYTFIIALSNSNNSAASNLRVYYTDGTYAHIVMPFTSVNTKQTAVFTSNSSKTIEGIKGSNYSGTITLYYKESGMFKGAIATDDFEAFVKHSYPLDDSIILRGIYKLDTNNQLYCDGDIYEADGTVTRRYVEYAITGVTESHITSYNVETGFFRLPTGRLPGVKYKANILSKEWQCITSGSSSNMPDKSIYVDNTEANPYIFIKDSAFINSTAENIASVLNTVTLIYELATPTEDTAQSYQSPQKVYADGIEEYILDENAFPLPVGHETKYAENLKKKLENFKGVDVQINGNSILEDGVANIPIAGSTNLGAILVSGYGLQMQSNGFISTKTSTTAEIKNGQRQWEHISPSNQHASAFYGLAKAAGDTTQSASSNAVGTYTDEAKKAIRKMLGIPNMTSELISEITTAEDLERVEITTDGNGLPFALRTCKIYVKLPASTTGASDFITAQYTAVDMNDTAVDTSFPTLRMTAASGSLLTYEFESFPGGMYFVRAFSSSNFGSSSGQMISMQYDKLIKCINRIRIRQYNQTATLIPAGTIIKLYGIRYDD